jgi:hypothetical protein
MSGDDDRAGVRPRHYRGRRRDPALSPHLAFLAVLAVAVCVVVAVNTIGSGARPLLIHPTPTIGVPTSEPVVEESVEPRPDTSRPGRSSTRPSPPASPAPRATSSPTPSGSPIPVSPGPPPPPSTYEAEAAENTLGTGLTIRNQSGASGGRVVGNVGNQVAATLRFNGVRALSGGRYTIRIYYLSGASRSAWIRVNGGEMSTLAFASTGGFDRVGSRTYNVDLIAGINTIEFGNSTSFAPDFDRIVV